MKRISLILSAAVVICGATILHAADETLTVPFERLKSGHIAVQVKINGKGPFRLGFDTGSPPTFISSKLAKELGLLGDGGGQPMRGIGGGAGGGRPATVDIEVGDVKRTNFPLMILDHPTVGELSQAMGGIEGLVGFSFMQNYKMTIDYEKQEFTLKPLSEFERRGRRLAQPRGRAVVFGATTEGASVTSVAKGSAAEQAGLQKGDRIISVNDRWSAGGGDFSEALAALAPGLPARVKIVRDGKEMELTVRARPGI